MTLIYTWATWVCIKKKIVNHSYLRSPVKYELNICYKSLLSRYSKFQFGPYFKYQNNFMVEFHRLVVLVSYWRLLYSHQMTSFFQINPSTYQWIPCFVFSTWPAPFIQNPKQLKKEIGLNGLGLQVRTHTNVSINKTRRYSPLCGPTYRYCSGLLPLTQDFFLLLLLQASKNEVGLKMRNTLTFFY